MDHVIFWACAAHSSDLVAFVVVDDDGWDAADAGGLGDAVIGSSSIGQVDFEEHEVGSEAVGDLGVAEDVFFQSLTRGAPVGGEEDEERFAQSTGVGERAGPVVFPTSEGGTGSDERFGCDESADKDDQDQEQSGGGGFFGGDGLIPVVIVVE